MNGKTAKLIRKYATKIYQYDKRGNPIGVDPKSIRRIWSTLPARERARRRKSMIAVVKRRTRR